MKSKINSLYISEHLKERLNRISSYPLTTIVAPAGYGKTNAARCFCRHLPEDSLILWQNVLSGSMTEFWRGFCELFRPVSEELAAALESMGGPPADGTTQREFIRLIQDAFRAERAVYIFIDDFHLVLNQESYDFILFCARQIQSRFHLALLSRRPILRSEDMLYLAGRVNELTERELRFGVSDILNYFSRCDCPITEQQAAELEEISEGWVSVLYLNLKSYADTGKFADPAEIHAMMSKVLYAPLPEEQKRILSIMSIFLEWGSEQARFITENEQADQLLREILQDNAFLYYSERSHQYKLHHLLQESVQRGFEELPQEVRNAAMTRAGLWFRQRGDLVQAMQFFYKASAFEQLMQTVEISLGRDINGEHKEQMLRWFRDCPGEILDAHPLAMLVYARRLYTFNMREECKEVFRSLRNRLETRDDIPPQLRNTILGEIEVNESFLDYNDIAAMSVHHRRAVELLEQPTSSISPDATWEFGSASVLMDYHREVGALDREVEIMRESMPFWYQINCNQGLGAEHLMEAEMHLVRGELDDTEICIHQAWNECGPADKLDMKIMTAFVWLRLRVLQGSFDAVDSTIRALRDEVRLSKRYLLFHTLDVCEAWLYALLGQKEPCAEWLSRGEFSATRLMFPVMPSLHVAYCGVLLARQEYTALIGQGETARRVCRVFPNVACEIDLDVLLAAAFEALGKREEAIQQLKQALELAMPDRIYLPFVCFGHLLEPLLQELNEERWQKELAELNRLRTQYAGNRQAILKRHFPQQQLFDLSEREMEIARLAADRKTNREIAEALHLSENTVKSTLRIIFQKIGLEQGGRGKKKALEALFSGENRV